MKQSVKRRILAFLPKGDLAEESLNADDAYNLANESFVFVQTQVNLLIPTDPDKALLDVVLGNAHRSRTPANWKVCVERIRSICSVEDSDDERSTASGAR